MCMDICHNIFSMSNFQIALLFAPLTLDLDNTRIRYYNAQSFKFKSCLFRQV